MRVERKVLVLGIILSLIVPDKLKYIDTITPFSYTWGSTEQTPGEHIITVKGYCSGEFQDSDSIRVKVV